MSFVRHITDDDIPAVADLTARAFGQDEVEQMRADAEAHAVLICGTGVGMAIAANKVHGIRAAVVHDELTAELSKSHLHANIICLSADLLGERLIDKVVGIWLEAEPGGPRHERRIDKISKIERGEDPRS